MSVDLSTDEIIAQLAAHVRQVQAENVVLARLRAFLEAEEVEHPLVKAPVTTVTVEVCL